MPDAAMPDPTATPGSQPAAGQVRELRAALLPEEVPVFDTEFRRAMAEATEALDLAPALDFLRRWSRIAAATTADPDAHRRMLALAADADAGRPLPAGEPWEAVKARLGL